MSKLTDKVKSICVSNREINEKLEPSRESLRKINATCDVLRRFQFLFDLPSRLRAFIEAKEYRSAVLAYSKAQGTLVKYSGHASFSSINRECEELVQELRHQLYAIFRNRTSSTRQLAECIDYFNMLDEPAQNLWDEFLVNADERLRDDLRLLEDQLVLAEKHAKLAGGEPTQDILEFVDSGCKFLSSICLVIASYTDMFIANKSDGRTTLLDCELAQDKVEAFTANLMQSYFDTVSRRVECERSMRTDTQVLVRAMDRFYRRLQAMNKLTQETDYARTGMNIVKRAASARCQVAHRSLCARLDELVMDLRQSVASTPSTMTQQENSSFLCHTVQKLETSLSETLKATLYDLEVRASW